jgi:hypothetical protein
MNIPPSNFRNALPRVGISESSDLPIATLAVRFAAAKAGFTEVSADAVFLRKEHSMWIEGIEWVLRKARSELA